MGARVIFCPRCQALVLAAKRCVTCGRWEREETDAARQAELLWQSSLPVALTSGITLAGDLVFVVDADGYLHAFDAAGEERVWPEPIHLGHWRVYERMATAGQLLVIGPTDSRPFPEPDKAILALDIVEGVEVWRRPLMVRHVSDPLAVDGVVYATTSDGFAIALNLGDGSLRWRQSIGGFFPSAPAIAEAANLVFFGSDRGVLTALATEDGRCEWSFTAEDDGNWHADLRYSPVVAGDTVYFTCWNRRCYALDVATGQLRWVSEPTIKRPAVTAPLVTEDAVYFCGHDRYVYCLDRFTGQRRWAVQFSHRSEAAPLLIDGLLYVAVQDRRVYALDPATGEVKGAPVLQTEDKVEKTWACDGQRIVLGDRSGHLYCLQVWTAQETSDPVRLETQGRWADAAAAYALAGDLRRAGDLYRVHNDPLKAAQLYEHGGDLLSAARQYEAGNDLKKARQLFRQLEQWLEVARLSEEMQDWLAAAQAYEKAEAWWRSAELYTRLEQWPQAAALFERAGAVAQAAGDPVNAARHWEQAAAAYERMDQPEKAVQLYKQAGQRRKAEAVADAVKGSPVELVVMRLLYGGEGLADLLALQGRHVEAAREYDALGRSAQAARMYSAAGEFALAAERYLAVGALAEAAQAFAQAGNWRAAAEQYERANLLQEAADAFVAAGDHRRAAELYETLGDWPRAAEQWARAEHWARAAQAWCSAGNPAEAAAAWKKADDLTRAAQCFWDAARQALADEERREQAAAWLEQAMQLFREEGDWERAAECDRQRRFLRKQPLLEVAVTYRSEYVFEESAKLEVEVKNIGWGSAQNIAFEVSGQFEADLSQDSGRPSLAPERSFRQSVYIVPKRVGRELPLTFTVRYSDRHGTEYRPLRRTFDISVRDKAQPPSGTPQQITVHGTVVMADHIEELNQGDQVRVHRARAEVRSSAPDIGVGAHTVTCAYCHQETSAYQPQCSRCRAPLVRCPTCGLYLSGRAQFCQFCGAPT